MTYPVDWQERAEHYQRLWRQERRRRRRAERSLEKLLRLDRASNYSDKGVQQLIDLFQQMTREALIRAARRKA